MIGHDPAILGRRNRRTLKESTMLIQKTPLCHEDFAVCQVSPRRWVVLSVYKQFFNYPGTPTQVVTKGAAIVYGPDLKANCLRFIKRTTDKNL